MGLTETTTVNFLEDIWSLSLLIPLLPFIAAFIILYVGHKKKNENLNHQISIGANFVAWIVSLLLFAIQMQT